MAIYNFTPAPTPHTRGRHTKRDGQSFPLFQNDNMWLWGWAWAPQLRTNESYPFVNLPVPGVEQYICIFYYSRGLQLLVVVLPPRLLSPNLGGFQEIKGSNDVVSIGSLVVG